MVFNSLGYLVFLPIVVAIYYLLPIRMRYIWLLVSSYYFYMCWSVKYAFLILFSTLVTYISALIIEKVQNFTSCYQRFPFAKISLVCGILLNLGVLIVYKYLNFMSETATKLSHILGANYDFPIYSLILPIGISFYTFQALGYLIDVYRGDIRAERNFFKYALFVSFFPQLVAGPIERSKNLMDQLTCSNQFDFCDASDGFLLMLWGYFMKVVIADRIAIFVDSVYGDIATYGGWFIICATVLFAFQIYCDFNGYSCIAIGTAKILGIRLMDNFNSPYLSCSISEFWDRWHISLSSWFRDYLYIPLGGNRKGRLREYVNKLIVFFVSGLWHGATWAFVMWGGIHGFFLVLGDILRPIKKRITCLLHLNTDSEGNRIIRTVFTFILTDFAWLFFRSQNTSTVKSCIQSIVSTHNIHILFDDSLFNIGLDRKNFTLMICSVFFLLIVDICKNKGICLRRYVLKQDYLVKGLVISISIAFILIFGIWGPGFEEKNFIYFQF